MCRKASRREYAFQEWVSPAARRLISRLLDPNPGTRITVADLVGAAAHPWLKRSLSVDSQLAGMLDGAPERALAFRAPAPAVNAFDIISMSPALDLSGLFSKRDREKRFMTTASPEKAMELIGSAGGKLGYVVVGKNSKGIECLPLGSGMAVMTVEMSEVAPPLMLVELRIEVADGDGDDEGKQHFGWEELRNELGDVVRAWHSCQDF
ncbi:unnamed protein product [Urochloa humidicola]